MCPMHASPSELTSPCSADRICNLYREPIGRCNCKSPAVCGWGMRQYGSSVHVFSSVMGTR